MELSARTLREVEFSGSLRGYNTDEVDEFLEKVAVGVDALHAEVRAAAERAADLERRLAEQPADRPSAPDDDPIRRTLVLAQRTADLAVKEAQEEAAQIVSQARSDAEAAISEARRNAERISEEGQRHLREEVLRLTTARDSLRSEAETLVGLLAAERDRLRESLGAALRYVERSLTPATELAQAPAATPEAATGPAGGRTAPSGEAEAPPESPAAAAAEAPQQPDRPPAERPPAERPPVDSAVRRESATTTPERPRKAAGQAAAQPEAQPAEERARPSAEERGRPGGERARPAGERRDAQATGDTVEPIVSLLSDEPAAAREEASAPASARNVVVAPEPVSWLDDERLPADGAPGDGAVGEFDDWGIDDQPPASGAGRAVGLSPSEEHLPGAEAAEPTTVERPSAAERLLTPAVSSSMRARSAGPAMSAAQPAARAWAEPSQADDADELDDLEAAIAEDAAAAGPAGRGYDDEFSWEGRRSLRRSRGETRDEGAERRSLTAVPDLDDTLQDAVVWQMNPSGPDTPA